ncbi:hypothetical protein [Sphingorhabdus sp. 109]|uniref:hypothetical protein n=1 Tax=Sphingorhabdus sp. 109 TaxID=2653173 RepID=UPI0012EF74F3|nr:hypothetical protein [Sphingorhabdus sp. 109]VWX56949.1 hypothetical protein SPHINGOR109_10796 [Sphingorhabdus sp. 109]
MTNVNIRALPGQKSDDFTDVVIRVSDDTMLHGWKIFEKLIKDSPDYCHMVAEGENSPEFHFDEDELKLLAGAFLASSENLPAGPHEYLRWIDASDSELSGRQYIDEFVAQRIKADCKGILSQLDNETLEGLGERITAFKHERAEWLAQIAAAGSVVETIKQVECEKAMAGASTAEVCEALLDTFDGDDLMDIISAIGHVIRKAA